MRQWCFNTIPCSCMNEQFDELIDNYVSGKVGVCNNFIPAELSAGLQLHIGQLQQQGLMNAAGIGNSKIKDGSQQVRSDSICWLNKNTNNIYERGFLQYADEFIARMNATCYTGINDSEFHYAVYGVGSFYKKHKDQFKTDDSRKYSLVTYLNDNWVAADGGFLRLFDNEKVQQVMPAARTAVLFKSDETEHEVMIANRPRLSISGWLKRV